MTNFLRTSQRLAICASALLGLAACSSDGTASVVGATTPDGVSATGATTHTGNTDTQAIITGATDATAAEAPDATGTVDTAVLETVASPTDSVQPGDTSAANATTSAPANTTPTATATPTTVKQPTVTSSTPTTRPAPATTRPPVTTRPTTTTAPSAPGSRSFSVAAEDTSPPVYNVALGTDVVLSVTSIIDQEFHLHDIDITLSGTRVTFRFTADLPGSHIVESHDTGKVICTFVIS